MRLRWECIPSPSQLLPLPLLLFLPLPLLLFLPLPLLLLLFLPLLLLVLRRHSERSEESPHFRGERSDPSAFLSHSPKHRHFDRSGSQPYREPRSGETRFSTHTAAQPKPPFCLLLAIPYTLFF